MELQAIGQDKQALLSALNESGAEIRFEGKSIKCPFHEDKSPSGGIYLGNDNRWRYKCHTASCGFHGDIIDVKARMTNRQTADVIREISKDQNRTTHTTNAPQQENNKDKQKKVYTIENLVKAAEWICTERQKTSYRHWKTYKYSHPMSGNDDLVVIRLHGQDSKKSFVQARQTGKNEYVFGAPDGELPLYRRDLVQEAQHIIFVEGEKAADALLELGITTTTCPGGANKAERVNLLPLAGKTVYLWPDNDAPNEKGERTGVIHMQAVAKKLIELGCGVFWIDPDTLSLPVKGDAYDFVELVKAMPLSEQRNIVKAILADAAPVGPYGEFVQVTEDAIAGKIKPVDFQWGTLSSLTRALLPKTITILCGVSGGAKSLFVMNAIVHWYRKGYNIGCLMLEDGVEYHMRRAFAIMAQDSGLTVQESYPQNAEYVREQQDLFKRDLLRLQSHICEPRNDRPANAEYVLEWIKRQISFRRDVIIVDPITLMDTNGERQWQEEAKFFREAKRIIEDSRSRLLLVTHPRKGAEGNNLDDLAGSASFTRAAQTVLWLVPHKVKTDSVRTSMGTTTADYNRTIKLLKCRNSYGERKSVAMDFDRKTFQFQERGELDE